MGTTRPRHEVEWVAYTAMLGWLFVKVTLTHQYYNIGKVVSGFLKARTPVLQYLK